MTVKQMALKIAGELRKNMTPAESVFWNQVKNKKFMGYKFLRQHPVFYTFWEKKKFFITDFYCRELQLVVEIDGGIHENQKEYDKARTEILETNKNLRIVRFKNEEVLKNVTSVLARLKTFVLSNAC